MNNGCLIIGFICFGEFAVGGREGLVKTISSIIQILFVIIIINGDDFGGVGCLLREKEASRLVATFQQVHDARLPYTPTT